MASYPKCSSLNELDTICNQIDEKIAKGFDELIKTSHINLNENKTLADEYYSLVKSNDKLEKQIRRLKIWRWILIIFLIFPFILMTKAAKKKQALLNSGSKQENEAKIKLDGQIAELQTKISYDFCFNQMIEPIWSDIDFTVYQDVASYKGWIPLMSKILPDDACFTCLVSGTLFNNPFMVYNYKHQIWQPHVYTGSVSIPYTVHVNGRTETRMEVATAHETIPEPIWLQGTELAYHFDKAEKLCFTNNTSKHEFKKWNKKNQLPLENKEFNKLFPTVRNDETAYRVLFTPLAQENYVKLLKEQKFTIRKENEVTITSLNSGNAYLDVTPNEAFNYNVITWKENYIKWVHNFVRSIALLTLPIANIPLYQHFKTNVKKEKPDLQIASNLQVEDNLTFLYDLYHKWGEFDTDVIFEPTSTKTIKIGQTKFSLTSVKCNYFWPDHQTIVKPTISSRGRTVMVPIHVIYYRPRVKTEVVCQSIDLGCDAVEQTLPNNMVIHRGQLMFLSGQNNITEKQISAIKEQLQKIKKA